MAQVEAVIVEQGVDGLDRIWIATDGNEPFRFYGAIAELVNVMAGNCFVSDRPLAIQARRECGACGGWHKRDRSCDCFDNGAQ